MSEIVCARCAASPLQRAGRPWCDGCGIWLVLHEPTGEWVGHGERERRQWQADLWEHVRATEAAVHANLDQARGLAPPGWRVDAAQGAPGCWPWYLRLTPQPGSPDVTASLHPPVDSRGWHVEISDRVDRVGYPLYIPGRARAASYPDLPKAIAAAVNAVRIACSRHQHDRTTPATDTGD